MAANILLILNLFILEGLLSIDNAAVLAVMVKDLPKEDHKKALRYGLLGAYAMRGFCLFIASFLIHAWVLKMLGGAYLIYLVYGHFSGKTDIEETKDKSESKLYKWLGGLRLSRLASTIILVEIMDLAFSIDNIFASVAISNNYWIIITGVFFGIAAMRFIAGWFIEIMERYPSLENSAFIVIAFLGIKLVMSAMASGFDVASVVAVFENKITDLIFSLFMIVIFFIPLLSRQKSIS